MSRDCVSHHNSCDCREEKIKRLVKAMRISADLQIEGLVDFKHYGIKSYSEIADMLYAVREEWEGEFE